MGLLVAPAAEKGRELDGKLAVRKLLYLLPIPVLLAGIAFARRPATALARPAAETAAAYAKDLTPATGEAIGLAYKWPAGKTVLYRFDSAGSIEVAPPAETKAAATTGSFQLSGVVAIRATDAGLEVQFRDVQAASGKQSAVAKFQGAVATMKMDERGRIHAIDAEDGVDVFLRHLEVALPEAEYEATDPAGRYTLRSRLDGMFNGGRVARISITRTYETKGKKGVGELPAYTTVAHFDADRGLPVTIDVTGALASKSAVEMKGTVRTTFALADVVDGGLAAQARPAAAAKPAPAEKAKPKAPPTLADIAPALGAPDKHQRAAAALKLGSIKTAESRAMALQALQDPEFVVRASAARALGTWKDEETTGVLARTVREDAADVVRLRAAQALAGTASAEGRAALRQAAEKDGSAYVRQIAAESLVVKEKQP